MHPTGFSHGCETVLQRAQGVTREGLDQVSTLCDVTRWFVKSLRGLDYMRSPS